MLVLFILCDLLASVAFCVFLFDLLASVAFLYSFLPLGLCCICEMKSKWRLEAKAKNKNEMNFGPFALLSYFYFICFTCFCIFNELLPGPALALLTSEGSNCEKQL